MSYRALHLWVERNLGKPDKCEHCCKSGLSGHQIHWANKSQEYKRELTDWLRLCVVCHKRYDGGKGITDLNIFVCGHPKIPSNTIILKSKYKACHDCLKTARRKWYHNNKELAV